MPGYFEDQDTFQAMEKINITSQEKTKKQGPYNINSIMVKGAWVAQLVR